MFVRFKIIWGEKWTRNFDDETLQITLHEWHDALNGISYDAIEKAIVSCKMIFEWPPSIAEFILICEKQMGVPSVAEVYNFALRREFNHPLVKMVFDKIGDWNFRNDSEKDLRKKVEVHYHDCLIKLRLKRNKGE